LFFIGLKPFSPLAANGWLLVFLGPTLFLCLGLGVFGFGAVGAFGTKG
jgi:hypothetical protein